MAELTTRRDVRGGAAARILVVDDVAEVRLVARVALEQRGFEVAEAADGESALTLVEAGAVDLVVLDVNLPGMSGLAVLIRIRHDLDLPVILLTGRQDETDRVLGLELGADDYIVKPFSPSELGARVASVLRRSVNGAHPAHPAHPGQQFAEPSTTGAVAVHLSERRVFVAGRRVELTPKEFDLLACLVAAPRRVFGRAELLEHVWGSMLDWQDPATVTEHIRRLRRKIEPDPDHPRWIQTVRGVGYRFEPGPDGDVGSGAENAGS